jgi:hypothetical protein
MKERMVSSLVARLGDTNASSVSTDERWNRNQ